MLELAASFTPATLPAGRPCAASIELVLRNRGTTPLTIYVGFASAPLLGWMGPFFRIELVHPDGTRKPPVCVRDHYLPPAPMAPSFVEGFAKTLRPGDAHSTIAPCAWYPFGTLDPRSIQPETLDPEGMDGLVHHPPDPGWPAHVADAVEKARLDRNPRDLPHSSILALGAFDALEKRRAKDAGFLRPGFFFATEQAGPHELRIGYAAHQFQSWTAKAPLDAQAAPVVLQLPRA